MKKRNIFKECRETVEQIGKANGKEGKAAAKQYVDEKAGNLPQGLENAVLLSEVPITLPSSASWSSVTYGNGKFVVVASSGSKAAYSSDGITWTVTTLPSSANWDSVTYGNGKFVAVAENSSKAAYSSDGITWYGDILALVNPAGEDVTALVKQALGIA